MLVVVSRRLAEVAYLRTQPVTVSLVVKAVLLLLGIGVWFVAPLLFSVSPRDPSVFSLVAFTLIAVAVAASWMPARRASRVDPNVVLRSE